MQLRRRRTVSLKKNLLDFHLKKKEKKSKRKKTKTHYVTIIIISFNDPAINHDDERTSTVSTAPATAINNCQVRLTASFTYPESIVLVIYIYNSIYFAGLNSCNTHSRIYSLCDISLVSRINNSTRVFNICELFDRFLNSKSNMHSRSTRVISAPDSDDL